MQVTDKSEIFANVADIVRNISWHTSVEEPPESHNTGCLCISIPESHDADHLHTVSPLQMNATVLELFKVCLPTSFLF